MSWSEYKYNDMIHRCFRCGYCKFPTDWSDVTNCPAYARHRLESYSTGGRLWLIRAWLMGEISWTPHLAEIIYSCVTCKNCVEKCPHGFNEDVVNMIVAARTEMVDAGTLPKPVTDFLTNVQLHGNPYGLPAKKRAAWMEGLEIPRYSGQEYLFHAGCEAAYDGRAQNALRAAARLLMESGVDFGVLGEDEICDGNEVDLLGEDALFEDLAQKNIQLFQKLGVQNIIAFSPHAYNAFKNKLPEHGGRFNVLHISQVLADCLKRGVLKAPEAPGLRVTFHDPCFLGRWNGEYKAPRKLLQAMPGLEFVEMSRNRQGALCCGGGAGNFITDFLGGSEDSPARIRAREAASTGASVLAVSCPNCLTMLEDAVKVEGLDEQLRVRGVSELLLNPSE